MITVGLGGPSPNRPDLPDEELPALYRKLDSADLVIDPEGLVSWRLTELAGQEEDGPWRNRGAAL